MALKEESTAEAAAPPSRLEIAGLAVAPALALLLGAFVLRGPLATERFVAFVQGLPRLVLLVAVPTAVAPHLLRHFSKGVEQRTAPDRVAQAFSVLALLFAIVMGAVPFRAAPRQAFDAADRALSAPVAGAPLGAVVALLLVAGAAIAFGRTLAEHASRGSRAPVSSRAMPFVAAIVALAVAVLPALAVVQLATGTHFAFFGNDELWAPSPGTREPCPPRP